MCVGGLLSVPSCVCYCASVCARLFDGEDVHTVQCVCVSSPGFFNREAVHSQYSPQGVVSTVHYVLLLHVIKLFLHDVLAQVEYHLTN